MYRAVTASLALLFVCCLAAAGDDKKNNEPFQGKWKITSAIANGQTLPAEQFEKAVLTVTGDERVLMDGDEVKSKAKYKVDPAKSPKTIDISVHEGNLKGRTFKGIYEVAGDTIKINVMLEGDEPPKDFTCQANSGRLLQVFKRIPGEQVK